ncbi:hypothetical protein COHA_007552 [Chlorella ohadii]|uniref:Uncharacterized protein n=1 Tax=Chlorella ohadii TaxID=2649997 RepID=A0AAD5GZW1_9CHLO|nr:hypothetical protein COHA_007552 [Chlorella ohadii]
MKYSLLLLPPPPAECHVDCAGTSYQLKCDLDTDLIGDDSIKCEFGRGGLGGLVDNAQEFDCVVDNSKPVPNQCDWKSLKQKLPGCAWEPVRRILALPAPTKLHISLAVLQLSPPELAAQRAGISLEEAFSIDQARHPALPRRHAPFECTQRTADRYMHHMGAALAAVPELTEDDRRKLHNYFLHTCHFLAVAQEMRESMQAQAQQAQQAQQAAGGQQGAA